ncbi:metallo proteinase [Plectosphaerella plurivora]|uniref:Neutral protease 2 n=1 Tax=Plectosphaerella plurivora TaxID=936078 RepID=A0A9P9A9F9_9PEZI|nr:metallo proteinase [Plectosphaerella plurivora]
MRFSAAAIFASALATAAAGPVNRETPLSITLDLLGNTAIKATIKNTGAEPLKVLKTGTILDEHDVEKVQVFSGSERVQFDGIRIWLDTHALTEKNFRVLRAGEVVEVEFDVAVDHDLGAGGAFDISSAGGLSYAAANSTEICGYARFASNTLTAQVDGIAAASLRRERREALRRRVLLDNDCNAQQQAQIKTAYTGASVLTTKAAEAARNGPASRMTDFFKSSSAQTRKTVADRFAGIATEMAATTAGKIRQHCTDIFGGVCSDGAVAYAMPWQDTMVNCPSWFNYPATTDDCRGVSQAMITIHEATHLNQFGATDDFDCYGYECVKKLSAAQNIQHADSYMHFVGAVHANC